jgi:hypothetical protein
MSRSHYLIAATIDIPGSNAIYGEFDGNPSLNVAGRIYLNEPANQQNSLSQRSIGLEGGKDWHLPVPSREIHQAL